ENLFQHREVRVGLSRSPQIRLGNDFDQRDAATVEIDVAPLVRIRKSLVEAFARVVLHMQALDADALSCAADFDFERALGGEGQLVHRDWIPLGQIGIKIVFAGETRARLDHAANRERRAQRQLQRAFIEHWQRTRQTQADRASIGIRLRAELCRAAAESLRDRLELRVDLEANDGFVARRHFRRYARRLLCGSTHDRAEIITSGRRAFRPIRLRAPARLNADAAATFRYKSDLSRRDGNSNLMPEAKFSRRAGKPNDSS